MNTQTEVLYVPPEGLLADANIRFSLKESRVKSLMEDIKTQGGVHTPLDVDEPNEGEQYIVTDGAYRLEAVTRLNKEGAGLTLPVIVHHNEDALARTKRQLSHNYERQDMTPMDLAVAIKALFDAGLPRIEIRQLFPRPSVKRGGQIQPASNAFINMMADFLNFSKSIQKKIHEGEIGVEGAYRLSRILKKDPTKLNAVLEEIEQARAKALAEEEKEEDKYLEGIKKQEDAQAKLEATKKEAEEAAAKLTAISGTFDESARVEADAHAKKLAAQRLASIAGSDEEKKASAKELSDAEAALKGAKEKSAAVLKEAEEAKRAKDKLEAKLKSAQDKAEEQKKKLEEARKSQGKAPKKSVGATEVEKAAKKVGADSGQGPVPLKLQDIRDLIHTGALPGSYPKVQEIFKALEGCINGMGTNNECYKAVAKITGEYTSKVKKGDKKADVVA